MADLKPDGGPAFPVPEIGFAVGMTLRDYFAAMAIATLPFLLGDDDGWAPDVMARKAYLLADAMLAAREK
ncbi:MAG TPA: hypothetical protein VEA16_09230 [Vicinamibacterales bacterium]|nr:hypothetical protein [Vicinamibacterales bacterium]